MLGFILAGLASAFNGLIGNPLFTAVFATELLAAEAGDKKQEVKSRKTKIMRNLSR
jgi:hypothetical protein